MFIYVHNLVNFMGNYEHLTWAESSIFDTDPHNDLNNTLRQDPLPPKSYDMSGLYIDWLIFVIVPLFMPLDLSFNCWFERASIDLVDVEEGVVSADK